MMSFVKQCGMDKDAVHTPGPGGCGCDYGPDGERLERDYDLGKKHNPRHPSQVSHLHDPGPSDAPTQRRWISAKDDKGRDVQFVKPWLRDDKGPEQSPHGIRQALRRVERAQRVRITWFLCICLVGGVGIGAGTAWLGSVIGGM